MGAGSHDELKDSLGHTVTLRSLSLKQYLVAKTKVEGRTLAGHFQDSGVLPHPGTRVCQNVLDTSST